MDSNSASDKKVFFLFVPFMEIYYLFRAIAVAIVYIFNFIFVSLPEILFTKTSRKVNSFYAKIVNNDKKNANDVVDGVPFSRKLKLYIDAKIGEIPFIKEKRRQREANLKILVVSQEGEDAKKASKKQTYRYLARNKDGKLVKGYFAALSKLDVYSYLIDEGLVVYEIETNKYINFLHADIGGLKSKMSNKDLIFWLTQLSTYIKAGIPLAESVKIIAKQDKRRKYKSVFDGIIYELTMGNSFSDALYKQGNVFPPLLINMIKSAEMIGDIEGTLDEMADYYNEIEENKKAIIGALTYPCMVLIFAIAIVVFMLVYIIPQFVDVYDSMGAELNPLTITILNISSYLVNSYKRIILVSVTVITLFIVLYKKVKSFRTFIQYIIMHLPVFGNLIIYKEMSVFARTFATLNKNNVLLTDSIEILRKITNNEIYKSIMFNTINNLLAGEKMSTSFKDHWAIPDIAYYMITTGESTGELATMLEKTGEYYQSQERNIVAQIKTLIEPIMIVLLGLIVGFILIAVLLPMFGMYNTIR